MILYRLTHPAYSFLWESDEQPPARWHDVGEGPVHYFATTPEGAWAELLRHEEITSPEDLEGLTEQAMWVVHVDDVHLDAPNLEEGVLTGGMRTYAECRAEAKRLRNAGSQGMITTSAALEPGGAVLYRVNGSLELEPIDSQVVILFGHRPGVTGQLASLGGRPHPRILQHVRRLTP